MKIEEKTLLRLLRVFEWHAHEDYAIRYRECRICKRYEHEGHKACDLADQIRALKWSIAMEDGFSTELNWAIEAGYIKTDGVLRRAIIHTSPIFETSKAYMRILRVVSDIIKELEQIGFEVRAE